MVQIGKYVLFFFLLLTCSKTLYGQVSESPIQEFVTNNGMKILLLEDHSKTEILGSIVVNVGSKNDPSDNTGMAHYLEHMLFKGTKELGTIDYEKERVYLDQIQLLYDELGKEKDPKKRKLLNQEISAASKSASVYALPNEFQRIIAEMGGTQLNAFTSNDMTIYLNKFPPNQFEKWLDLYVHRFKEPVFRLFQTELETVYEEKNRKMNVPMNYLIEQFFALSFEGHPYGDQTTLGKTEHLKNPSLSVMYEYFYDHYVPSNMALILIGDFDTESILPIIKTELNELPDRTLKKKTSFQTKPISGRRERTIKSSPIKMAVYGFKTGGQKKINEAKFDLMLSLLSNESETGLLDDLSTSNKMLGVLCLGFNFVDDGVLSIISIPKLLGQSFEEAEELIFAQLDRLKKGDFTEEMVETLKRNLIQEKKIDQESKQTVMLELANYFLTGTDQAMSQNYIDELETISKEDIVSYANEIFGNDFIVLYSKRGSVNHERLEKPGNEPVVNRNTEKSEYYQFLSKMEETKVRKKFVDFESALQFSILENGVALTTVKNPKNSVFNLTYCWEIGTYESPEIMHLERYLNAVGTHEKSFSTYREALQKLSASYYFEADDTHFYLKVIGEDSHFSETLVLIDEIIKKPELDESQTAEITDLLRSDLKFNAASTEEISAALQEYALYGNKSTWLNELSIEEVEAITAQDYLELFSKVKTQSLSIQYVGNNNGVDEELKTYLNTDKFSQRKSVPYFDREELKPTENRVYFIHNKKSTQAHIRFNFPTGAIPIEDHYKINAFNTYFGVGMSSIIFQEIREFRSLAYSAYGICRPGKTENSNALYTGFIGCQNDKVLESVELMCQLLSNMPVLESRIEFVKGFLIRKSTTAMPDFRELGKQVSDWKQMGYDKDPNELFESNYENLIMADIVDFYTQYIKTVPITISIVGNKKEIDLDALSKWGTVIQLDKETVMNQN